MLELNKIYCMDCLEGLKDCPPPHLIVSDPPYEFQASGKGIMSKQKVMDKIKEIGTNSFNFSIIPKILSLQKGNINAYFFTNKTLLPHYLNYAIKHNISFDLLFMVKNNPLPCKNKHYVCDTEYIVFYRKGKVCFNNDFDFNYYKKHYFINIGGMELIHPNQKPIELIRKLIKISSKEGDLVLDPFMGSGTTAVAATQIKRNYIGFEINKEIYDKAIQRVSKIPANLNNLLEAYQNVK